MFLPSLVLGLASIVLPLNALDWELFSRYDYFAKRVSPGLFTGGLLTERELQYLQTAGFGSVITIADNNSTMDEFNDITGPFPSSIDEVRNAQNLGMDATAYKVSLTVTSVYTISNSILHMKKPIYLHCYSGYTASLYASLHLYLMGSLDAKDFYNFGLSLGYDYQADPSAVSLVSKITGLAHTVTSPAIESPLALGEQSYLHYYWAHRVGNDYWYNIGQPLDTQVTSIAASGYKTVISFRNNGESTTRLSTDPVQGPIKNHEFSDSNGLYDVKAEAIAFEQAGVKFLNLPVTGSSAWTVDQLISFTPALDEAMSAGPVLAHCASGYRSSGYIVAYLAKQQGKCLEWALQESKRIGYSFSIKESDAAVVAFFRDVLGC